MNNLFIEEVQIEGGFLDGMNVHFKGGLNTIIGARGTGKSTLIELIRYCLDIKGHTSESNSRSQAHAKSVLKDGQIFLTLSDGQDTYRYSRIAGGETIPRIPDNLKLPLIFSQTEVENIGLISSGRLKLIDDFIDDVDDDGLQELSSISLIESYSSDMMILSSSITDTEDKLIALTSLKIKLKELEDKEKALTAVSAQATEKSQELRVLSDAYLAANSGVDTLTIRKKEHIETLKILASIPIKKRNAPLIHNGPLNNQETINQLELDALAHINLAVDKFSESSRVIDSELQQLNVQVSNITNKGQKLRSEVDKLQKGAGELSRMIQSVKKNIADLENIQKSNVDKSLKIIEFKSLRDEALEQMCEVREQKTKKRLQVCNKLNRNLHPKIRVHIEECSQLEEYQQVIINALKGSGVKYNDLAPMLVEAIPPQVLLKIIEENDIELFLTLLNVSRDRGYRIINALKFSISAIATVKLEDEIILELLDGSETKKFNELSTGQRCTVILPIILEHKDSILIVDQPEDHIDNAFIVDTLIASIKRRKGFGQTIVTTHNANVPVLGEAEEIIHLNSDGTRGYIMSEGALNDLDIIDAISNVMEGGREAFAYRAKFYER